jgi:hypothetical protein
LGSLSYPLLELSFISSDKEILARSYQNPFLVVALLSEALAGVKEKEVSRLLTMINSHSELPLLLRILLPSLKDITFIRPHTCAVFRCRKNCQGTRDLLSIRRSITSHRAERQTDCLRKRRTVRRTEGTSSPHWTTFSWASTTHVPGVVHATLWNAVLVNWRGTRAPQMSARMNIRMSRTPLPAPQSVKRPR